MKSINIKKIAFYSALILPFGLLSGCSDDEETGPETFPYWVLEEGNSNMPSSGVVLSQYKDSPVGADVCKLVDNDKNTSYITSHSQFYVLWNGNKSIAVNYYSLTSASDAQEKDPKSWTLYGSEDNKIWIRLDRQMNQTFTERGETKEYEFENESTYRYYRLSVESNGGASSTQMAEWVLKGIVFDNIDDLMDLSSGNSFDATTPMGNHYANRHVTTDEDREWLMDAANEPDPVSGLRWTNFTVENLYPYGTPQPADVNQHGIGDCSALAVFASMAYVYPNFVKSLIKDNTDQTYTVAMFDPQGKKVEVTVSSQFLADNNGNLGTVTGKNSHITWATILEKAIMKWNHIYKVNPDINGIGSEHVAPLFTGNGNSFAFSPGTLNAKQLKRAVEVSMNQGKIVVGGFTTPDLPAGTLTTVTGHAFTMMYSTDSSALFSMRNPWGNNSSGGKEDGVLNIPDNDVIPPIIDLRIIEPGIAPEWGMSILQPYIPPMY